MAVAPGVAAVVAMTVGVGAVEEEAVVAVGQFYDAGLEGGVVEGRLLWSSAQQRKGREAGQSRDVE